MIFQIKIRLWLELHAIKLEYGHSLKKFLIDILRFDRKVVIKIFFKKKHF
jgi:hypothetical protein